MAEFVKVASVNDLANGDMMLVELDEQRVLLTNVEGDFHAIGEVCAHEEGPLSEGFLEGHEVECPWHGSLFDVRSGENTGPPASDPVPRYTVRIEGDDVLVGPPE